MSKLSYQMISQPIRNVLVVLIRNAIIESGIFVQSIDFRVISFFQFKVKDLTILFQMLFVSALREYNVLILNVPIEDDLSF